MNQKWKVKGSVLVSMIPIGLFFFKFIVFKYMAMVLAGSWYYGKHGLMVAKWFLSLDLVKELNKMTLIWVRLTGLPL